MGSNSNNTAFDPILDVTAGMTDDEITERFRWAIKLNNLEKRCVFLLAIGRLAHR